MSNNRKGNGSGWLIGFMIGALLWGLTKSSSSKSYTPSYRSTPSAYQPYSPSYTAPRNVAENGSYYGQPNAYGVPKTVPVQGYYRNDGTHVQGHYRSRPSR